MANVFLTADTHFGHTNVIKFCARSIMRMNLKEMKP